MGNKNLIITIEREYGSGGRIVGRKLAEELGLHFYDDEILKMASEKSAVGEEFFRLADEKAGNNLFHRLAGAKKADVFGKPSLKGDVTSPDNLFKFQAMVMRELAEQEPCVFVGRAAGYVLDQDEEIENLVRIFVYADMDAKIARCRERGKEDPPLSDKELKQKITKMDKGRAKYYEFYTGQKWGDRLNYDVCINTSGRSIKELAAVLVRLVN